MKTQLPESSTQRAVEQSLQPHDNLTFEQLQDCYSYGRTSDRRVLFTKLVLDEIEKRTSPTVLEIGCGSGMGMGERAESFQNRIADSTEELWGLEPSDSIVNPRVDKIERVLFEDARFPDRSVDVAYSHMVMEHVTSPVAFFENLNRVLKPGGVYLFLTPNGRSYFGRIGRLAHRIHIDEILLGLIKKRESIEEYHFPVAYKCNDEREIEELCRPFGLGAEFAYYERRGAASYFPRWAKPVQNYFCRRRENRTDPKILINLVCRVSKPPVDNDSVG